MALTKCADCGGQLSDAAVRCPGCGAPPPKKKMRKSLQWLLWCLLAAAALPVILGSNQPQAVKAQSELDKKQEAEDMRALYVLVLTLRKGAKDPDSLKVHNAFITSVGASCVEYSATNSYNARLRAFAIAPRGKDAVFDDVAAWNKLCANLPSTNYTTHVQRRILDQ